MKIQLAPLSSKHHFEAITLREDVLGTKVDLNKEEKLTIFVAIEKGKVIGTAAVELYPFGIARIRQVAVSPAYQGKAVGTRLLARCESFAREQRRSNIILTGRKSASRFYLKQDYRIFLFPFQKHHIDFFWLKKKVLQPLGQTQEAGVSP